MMAPVKGLVLFLMIVFLQAVFGDKHSLLYLYTMQSKNSDSNIYDCTAVTLLNDRHIDFYNSSSDKPRTAKQNWLKNISESDWKTSTEKLQYDTQLLNRLFIDIQMSEFGHSYTGVHVVQWRHGCEGKQSSDGSLTVLNSINELGYDGEDLIQLNHTCKTWLTPEKKKNREREEKKNREREETWSKIFNTVWKCDQCEEMLKIYLQNSTNEITQSNTPPDVHIFANKSVNDWSKWILTCMATGFYPKDVKMSLRKFTTEIPDHLITSSGVRPNDDGTYQLRKSVEISYYDPADYNCYVSHSSLTEPVIKRLDGKCPGLTIGVWVLRGLLILYFFMLCGLMVIKKCATYRRSRSTSHSAKSSKGRISLFLNICVPGLGVVIFLCFVIPGSLIIKTQIPLDLWTGVWVPGVIFLILTIIYVVVMIKRADEVTYSEVQIQAKTAVKRQRRSF